MVEKKRVGMLEIFPFLVFFLLLEQSKLQIVKKKQSKLHHPQHEQTLECRENFLFSRFYCEIELISILVFFL